MKKLTGLCPEKVFKYFEELCSIPHGSSDMEKISDWCVEFAKSHGLRVIKDSACNVVIFKGGSVGYESASPIILQGHLDMVCQKSDGADFDFKKDGLDLFVDSDFIRAKDTTLGGDDGIAVAIILALLDSTDIPHPPIEAVFTTDEETGMSGALALDTSVLKGKTMINIDSEVFDTVTVACAGGRDVKIEIPLSRREASGKKIKLVLDGLCGGHSGIDINKGRTNASVLLGRVLNHLRITHPFDIVSLFGGDKTNVITSTASAEIIPGECDDTLQELKAFLEIIKEELSACEPSFNYTIEQDEVEKALVMESALSDKIICLIASVHQGVAMMSTEIEGLVESSQNLGIMNCTDTDFTVVFSLRSSKNSALQWLEERLRAQWSNIPCQIITSGAYPPWEYSSKSRLRELWCESYKKETGAFPKIEAIHAGLECGIFSAAIKGLDCISIGPDIIDIHTTSERLCVSSTKKLYKILLDTLKQLK